MYHKDVKYHEDSPYVEGVTVGVTGYFHGLVNCLYDLDLLSQSWWNGHRMGPGRWHVHEKYKATSPCMTGVMVEYAISVDNMTA